MVNVLWWEMYYYLCVMCEFILLNLHILCVSLFYVVT